MRAALGIGEIGMGRHKNYECVKGVFPQRFYQSQSAHSRHSDIHQKHLNLIPIATVQRFFSVRKRSTNLPAVVKLGNHLSQPVQNHLFIINKNNVHGFSSFVR